MRAVWNNCFGDESKIQKDSPSATIWANLINLVTKRSPNSSGEKICCMDNFFTKYTLTNILKEVSGNECKIIGTMKFTNVDRAHIVSIEEGIKLLKEKDRGL